jgi:hypothetical protein
MAAREDFTVTYRVCPTIGSEPYLTDAMVMELEFARRSRLTESWT